MEFKRRIEIGCTLEDWFWTFGTRIVTERVAELERVSDLIIPGTNCWDHALVFSTFSEEEAKMIVSIPLPLTPQIDKLIWPGEHSGVFFYEKWL